MWSATLLFLQGVAALKYYDPHICGREVTYTNVNLTDSNGNTGNPVNMAPWAVQIMMNNKDGSYGLRCGGVLITEKHVLTAAHCFKDDKFNPKRVYRVHDEEIVRDFHVVVGAMCSRKDDGCDHLDQLGKVIGIKRSDIQRYFQFNRTRGEDLAILELEESIKNIPTANYACLPFEPFVALPENTNLTVSGFGENPAEEEHSPVIQLAELKPQSDLLCRRLFHEFLPADAFCTVEEKNKAICRGDTGGGLTFQENSREYLHAITSHGTDCQDLVSGAAQPKMLISTEISYHVKFIMNFINSSE